MLRTRTRWLALGVLVLGALALGRSGAEVPPRAAGPSVGTSYPPSWSPYVAPDGSFRLMAPGAATERSESTASGVVHRVSFASPPETSWFVAWLDGAPPVVAGRSDADLVDLAAAPLAERLGAVIEEEDVLRDGPYPGVELRLSTDRGVSYAVRVFAVRGRLVEVAADWTSASERAEAERFVRSLQLG